MTKSLAILCVATAGLLAIGAAPAPQQAAPQTAAEPSSSPVGDVERGRYIVERVAMCVECHSTRDGRGNILPASRFKGGPMPPGPSWAGEADWATYAPRNAGLPAYSDEMAMRLLTEGAIGRLGEQLRAPMPRFRMNPQDAADVIAYMRSVP